MNQRLLDNLRDEFSTLDNQDSLFCLWHFPLEEKEHHSLHALKHREKVTQHVNSRWNSRIF